MNITGPVDPCKKRRKLHNLKNGVEIVFDQKVIYMFKHIQNLIISRKIFISYDQKLL